jgi:hypothetical protein
MLDWRPDMLDAVLKMKHQGARLRLALTTRCLRLLALALALAFLRLLFRRRGDQQATSRSD